MGKSDFVARFSRWSALVSLVPLALLLGGCGRAAVQVTSCGFPYTFSLPGGRQVLSGACPGFLYPDAPAVTVRRGETFSVVITSDLGRGRSLPVPRPNGPAVQILSRDNATVTYRAVQAGSASLIAHHTPFCIPLEPPPVTGIFRARYFRERAAFNLALEHQKPHTCPALVVRVIG